MASSDVSAIIQYALSNGLQVNPDALRVIKSVDAEEMGRIIKKIVNTKIRGGGNTINKTDIEVALGIVASDEPFENKFEVLFDPTPKTTTAEGVVGFVGLFASRYEKMKKIIEGRPEAKALKRVETVKGAAEKDEVHTCGLVWSRTAATKERAGRFVVEDDTGLLEFLAPFGDVGTVVGSLMEDQFVMVRAVATKNGFVAKEVIVPDIAHHETRRSRTNTYAVFLSDLHVGSRYFLDKEFDEFVGWLASDEPTASHVGYVLMCGDVVDGVGVYPNQDKELVQITAHEQLARLDELVAKIPERIKVIITPGNHDPGRKALPQPAIPRKVAPELWQRSNVHMLGNPARVWLNGVHVLMYHGQSIDDVVKVTPGLSYEEPLGVMKHLLKARHMSPIYGANTPIAPETEDMMVIEDVPDIFHAGHVHVMGVEKYRGVTMINSGTWQSKTPFQESVKMEPSPGRVVLVNLKTLKASLRVFV